MSATLSVVIAPDSFKGSAAAAEVADAIASGWRNVRPGDDVVLCPQADGGEGTIDAVASVDAGARRRSAGMVTGPDRRLVAGEWLELADGTAVIEMAQMSGLPLMGRLDPLGATSEGLGQVIAAAIDAGAERLVIGLGGSASTDGGAPVLSALGRRRPPRGGAVVLTDVTNPLLGAHGAAAVFGPQKGASLADVLALEARLAALTHGSNTDPSLPGMGAAGGVAFGLADWGAQISSGSSYIASLTGLDVLIARADVVITGEGRCDDQSFGGKVVGNISRLTASSGARLGIIAGSIDIVEPVAQAWTIALTDLAGSVAAAIAAPELFLVEAGRRAARALAGA